MPGRLGIGGTAEFGDPDGDVVVVEERVHDGELVAVEGAFAGADDEASHSRSGLARAASGAAASGRRAHGTMRV
ncbi:hypothetical protein AOB60_07090 [Streptomyces noursei]|uniref:Uncharacterized protein n=1 Tax=Streptomyces noursei TaxID=1971 RepID=A0A2N8PHX0_STRNR|nr:hypothetical protein AOB60_07090 [Streptomyces noursei]